MKRAKIRVLNDSRDVFEVQFNPTEYTDSFRSNWQNDQFIETTRDNFSVDLFFDSYQAGHDVREDYTDSTSKKIFGTKRFASLVYPSVSGQLTKQPPPCIFTWGNFSFTGHVQEIKQNFTMFTEDGIPVRAKLSLTFKHFPDQREIRRSLGVEACRKARVIKEGDRLDLIAAQEMKDANLWPMIAKVNNIENPFFFPEENDIGRTIIIPDVNEKIL
ncbi:peptidoglycan-binding protein LysM [Candidatus Uabimicrobium sp. HlEnr_7]|uniref:CIS tube protein n=1 Tax=Candidatus Uabimicrobium helgolandensis TaxID=3095367 RepID=UPI0035582115